MGFSRPGAPRLELGRSLSGGAMVALWMGLLGAWWTVGGSCTRLRVHTRWSTRVMGWVIRMCESYVSSRIFSSGPAHPPWGVVFLCFSSPYLVVSWLPTAANFSVCGPSLLAGYGQQQDVPFSMSCTWSKQVCSHGSFCHLLLLMIFTGCCVLIGFFLSPGNFCIVYNSDMACVSAVITFSSL